ncbi:transposable element Tcb2 transposase [Trichonephila clavipes]|uniref:Transposable element Tcb2 transposase n=1 Tax=Trichonephila clavipes TaxID=2585209 RepID=A0A8X6SNQ4_TRICX|nr:transposable element Tcb2 transposase [Trichonephila clavipes]
MGAITYNIRSPLILIHSSMTAHEILQPHVLSLMQWLTGAIFQRDNAWPHTAKVSKDCLLTVNTLPWHAGSPALFLIEHICDHLGRRVGHPTSLNKPRRGYRKYGKNVSRHHAEKLILHSFIIKSFVLLPFSLK